VLRTEKKAPGKIVYPAGAEFVHKKKIIKGS
jgi:hypothetical protein